MIEFILSKFGILLFAFSVAGILIVFMGGVKDIFIAQEGMQISSIISKQLREMADAPSLCSSTYVSLPRYLDVIGETNNVSSTSIFYNMDVNVIDYEDRKIVAFTLINKRSFEMLSIESFQTLDDINFYFGNAQYTNTKSQESTYLTIDPTETSILYMVKSSSTEENQSLKTIYFVPCVYDRYTANPLDSCYSILKELFDLGATCVPTGTI